MDPLPPGRGSIVVLSVYQCRTGASSGFGGGDVGVGISQLVIPGIATVLVTGGESSLVERVFAGQNPLKPAPCQAGRSSCRSCLLYTSDAADDLTRVDLGGRRIITK